MVLLPEMGASCVEEPPIWTSGVTALEEEATSLVFEAIFNGEFFRKDEKKKEKARSFSWVFRYWMQKINEEEKSLMMTLERLLSFYRRSDQSRYMARISRSIVTRRVAMRPEREYRV